jgi:hypothetical protein
MYAAQDWIVRLRATPALFGVEKLEQEGRPESKTPGEPLLIVSQLILIQASPCRLLIASRLAQG